MTDAMADASNIAPCWAPIDTVAKGEVILGTGVDQYELIGTELPLVFGATGGISVVANVQMRGLAPGNPSNLFDPTNPRTRILAYFADTGVLLNRHATGCPYRVGYEPVDATTYVMAYGVTIPFDVCWHAEHLIGRRIRIKLEVLDASNGYTTDERVATIVAPAGGSYPIERPGKAGCPVRPDRQ